MPAAKDITGNRYGRLTVISFSRSKNKKRRWNCICDCGNKTEVVGSNLGRATFSCGCLQQENTRLGNNATHGMKNSLEYSVWVSMKQRCLNQNHMAYHNYGGRGITVCERWMKFENFIEDMGVRPSKGLELDRINNEEGYCKDNCRWATRAENAKNRRKRVRDKTGKFTSHTDAIVTGKLKPF